MSTSTDHDSSHLSIGEVLSILREEFPDVTISKIRFLESQGLIDPERTPSGYRKFYDADVSRLRWILHQQRENFLPLRVIKERLDDMDRDDDQPAPVSSIASRPAGPAPRRRSRRSPPLDPDVAPPLPLETAPDGVDASASGDGEDVNAPRQEEAPSHEADTGAARTEKVAAFAKATPAPEPEPPPQNQPGLTREELAAVSGLEEWQLADLESFGLITPFASADDDVFFDDEGLAIAKATAGFYSHGIGARHLRMYKHFAEREAALFEQVSIHYLRQRNPEARAKAQEELATLSRLGRALRAALLVQAIRDSLFE
jgi:DNA-binding transcriptional MerR regulator